MTLALRQAPDGAARARSCRASIERAKVGGPKADGQGIIAASRRLSTDGGRLRREKPVNTACVRVSPACPAKAGPTGNKKMRK